VKQFKYTLQVVHDIRERNRDTAELEVAQVLSELARTAMLLETVIQARQRAAAEFCKIHSAREIASAEVAANSNYINSLMLRERDLRNQITDIERQVEAKRRTLTETARDAEVTAKLREHKQQRHRFELACNEQKMLDEMAIMRMARAKALHR
jgi:flagellar export protein FliJ